MSTSITTRSILLSAAVLLLPVLPSAAQTATYTIDPNHSEVDFSIRHMAISTVHGRFSIKSGSILLNPSDLTKSSVTALIETASVDTSTPNRDKDLKSANFFEVDKYPTATFKSTSVKTAGDGFDVVGDLTLHGVTKPVTLHMDQPSKEQIGMDGKSYHRGFSATTTLHRQDFNLTWQGNLKSGDNVLGDDVKMTFEVEAVKQ